MQEILKMLNSLKADELDALIVRANILLEMKRREEAGEALREKERLRQEKIEQEKQRLREIAELERKLQELQSRKADIPDPVQGDGFVMQERSNPARVEPKIEPENVSMPAQLACPHCRQLNAAGSQFCAGCGQRMNLSKAAAAPANAGTSSVRYADESMKEWQKQPGEMSIRPKHEIVLLAPEAGRFAYYMEVTNRRILLTRESSASKNAGFAAAMGGGLLGSMIAEGVKAASGKGPKPWLEIPLTAISSCGVQNGKEFYIVADQTYVLKNKKYEKLLPDLIAQAKASGA